MDSARAPAIAKLTRPKPYGALSRPRLYALLDEAAAGYPIVWVGAPPGAGKSTLVSDWIQARDRPNLWYQVDPGDAVPATLAHYLRLAARQLTRGQTIIARPLHPPQPQQELGSFARALFRDLCAQLPRGCVVVLDNFHEAPMSATELAALAQGLQEIPDDVNLVIVSRTDPPPEFSRLVANRRIACIDPAALRCTPDETATILHDVRLASHDLQRVQRASNGWLAALVLLREHLKRGGASVDDSLGEGREAIFQYFASEIFARADAAERRKLMLSAVPPSVTPAEAVALTGDADAGRMLESLYRRHLFVERRHGAQMVYHYHALFREFLLERGRCDLDDHERRGATVLAAHLLAERGQTNDALTLARGASDWQTMHELILSHAASWSRQGRGQVISDWIDALPATVRDDDPWLAYWQGRAWVFVQPQRSRPLLERAWQMFRDRGETQGQALTLALLVTGCHHEWADFGYLDRWLPELERLLGSGEPLDRATELRVCAAHLIVLLFRGGSPDAQKACAARVDALVDDEGEPDARVLASSTLFNYCNWSNAPNAADALVARTTPILANADVSPLTQLWWHTHVSFWHYTNGRYSESVEVAEQARALAKRYGLEAFMFEIDHAQAQALINQGELAAAKALVDAIEPRLSPLRRMDHAYFHHLRSTLAQRLGDAASAMRHADRALMLARESGVPPPQIPHFIARLGHARAGTGDPLGALTAFDEAVALAVADDRLTLERMRELIRTEGHIAAGETERARNVLAAELAARRAQGHWMFVRSRPDGAARLAAFALEQGIEADFVHELIRRNELVAPPGAGPSWPFRLRIHALGGFELVRDGEPMRFTGKAQQRPLDLLKLVVAHGPQGVAVQPIIDALWPDADGAAAKTSFDSTLFRLRKLLDIDDVLTLAGGRLSLTRGLAWTDVEALEQAIDGARQVRDGTAAESAARRLLDAYRGPLFGDDEHTWALRPRDTLRARFVGAIVALGEGIERGGDRGAAAALYRRGLEADNLAESLHRALIRVLAAAGQQAEALNAFRRCRELLSVVLGVQPSDATEALYRQILAGHVGPGA